MYDFVSHLDRIERKLTEMKVLLEIPKCDLMNYKEASEYMGISEGYLRVLKAENKIDSFQPSPRIVRFSSTQCDTFLRSSNIRKRVIRGSSN